MQELWLNFSDADGVTRRVRVEGERFVIGRQPDCDLAISDARLSRQHAVIERFGGRYEIADLGSSNGTELRGSPVIDAVPIYDGDAISLGGLVMRAEIAEAAQATAAAAVATPAPTPSTAAKPAKAKVEKKGGIPLALLLMAPILAVVLVVVAGGVVYLVVARGSGEIAANTDDTEDPIAVNKKDDEPETKKTDDTPSTTSTTTTSTTDSPANTTTTTDTPAAKLSDTAKIEVNGASFMRNVAQKDDKAFLTTEQAQRVGSKVKQLSGSSAVADNIKSAQKNAAKLRDIATRKNLKPQFLAVAAIARLGNSRGDVVQTAESISDVLDKLSIHIGTERADDCLLTIAAYEQGAAGETMKMRNMLQDLATKATESSRTIRTIWFLQKEGKITPAEFDRALTFLAVGTIAQNPKDFSVNAEALNI